MGIVEQTRAGIVVRVRVKPRAARDEMIGVDARGVSVSVRAAPERGKANVAVIKVLARVLGVPASSLSLRSGEASRDKRILIVGLDVAEVRARLGLV